MKFNKADDIKLLVYKYNNKRWWPTFNLTFTTLCRKPICAGHNKIKVQKSIIHLVHVLVAASKEKCLSRCSPVSLSPLLRLVLLATMEHVLFWSVIWLVWQLRYCSHCHRRYRHCRCRPSRCCAVETIRPPWWTPGRRLCPRAHPPRSKLDSVY